MTTPRTHGTLAYWQRNDTHAIDRARTEARGPGLDKPNTRWCIRCQCDRPREGGYTRNNMWFCVEHPRKVGA